MKYISLSSIAFLMFLTGCATTEVKEPIVKVDTKVISIPDALLTSCKVTQPIKPSDFIVLSADKKEEVLTDLNIKLYKDLGNCNNQITQIKNFQDRQKVILKGPDK